jgi:phage terminase large subunit GpA-like protein
VNPGADPWHRDGLLFQAISWIAAHQSSKDKSSVFSLPHMIAAHKGFDGLEVELTRKKELFSMVVFEDKATENPRNTITTDVWPEIKALHRGNRQSELMQELTALLQRAKVDDPDAVIEAVVWNQVRKFRVSITGTEGQDQQQGFEKLFKGFDDATPGLDQLGRRAEVFCHSDIRKWMESFAIKVSQAIDAEKAEK